jgi:MFS family permease
MNALSGDRALDHPLAITPDGSAAASTDLPEPLASTQSYPSSASAWYCVFVLALAVMVNFLDRGILTLLVEPIKADLHLSDVQMSLVMGFAFTFFYAILGLPVARLVDRKVRQTPGPASWMKMIVVPLIGSR